MTNTEVESLTTLGSSHQSFIGFSDIAFDDPSSIIATDDGWDYDIYQLSAGPLGYRLRRLEIDGLVLEWAFVKASVAVHEVKQVTDLSIAIPLELSAESYFGGQRLGFGDIASYGFGSDFCHKTSPGVYTLFVTVDRSLADKLGWPDDPSGTVRKDVPKDWLRGILSRIDSAVRLIELSQSELLADRSKLAVNALLLALHDLMGQIEKANERNGFSANAQRNMLLVAEVRHRLLSDDWWDNAAIERTANALGVSERTLYRAISASIGMAPRAYQKRLRLHLVRQALKNASPEKASVTDIAMEHGFWHLGRFSQEFREVFGERPSQALKSKADLTRHWS